MSSDYIREKDEFVSKEHFGFYWGSPETTIQRPSP